VEASQFETDIESALWTLETEGDEDSALEVYQRVTSDLEAALAAGTVERADALRVLSYGYLRQANLVRVRGDLSKARDLGEKSILLGRESGDALSLARALLNHAPTLALMKDPSLKSVLDDSLSLFSAGSSKDHAQGVGWYWILVADICAAGLMPGGGASEMITAAERALQALTPIENWQGIARAYSVLERAYIMTGDMDAARRASESLQKATEKARDEKQ